jgi:ribosome-binding factor A
MDIAPDLSHAKILVSIMGSEEKLKGIEALNHSAGFMRTLLGKRIHIRKIPRLQFYLDESLEQASKINQLLSKLKENDQL